MLTSLSSAHASPAQTPSVINNRQRIDSSETAIDQALVRRYIEGDEAAFVQIMDRYRAKIFSVTHSLLRNYADAEEITQDTFIRAHRGLATFRGDSALSTWLYRIAVNLSRNRYWYFFRRRRHDALSLDMALGEGNTSTFTELVADPCNDPAQETASKEFTTLVDRCMERLDSRHREVLVLRNIFHRSYDEIAKTLEINPGTVKSRIARARDNLRMLLAETCPEFGGANEPLDYFLPSRTTYGSPVLALG